MVVRVGVEVGEVEQQQRAGALDELADERRLVHLRLGPLDERRDVLERERHGERLLGDRDVLGDDLQRRARARHRQQVAGLAPVGAHERDVLADERRVDALRDRVEVRQARRLRPLGARPATARCRGG